MKAFPPSGFVFFARIPNNEIINGRNHVFLAGKPGLVLRPLRPVCGRTCATSKTEERKYGVLQRGLELMLLHAGAKIRLL